MAKAAATKGNLAVRTLAVVSLVLTAVLALTATLAHSWALFLSG